MTLIKEVNGDLLEATENLIVHQVNCMGKMGSGIAEQVKNKWYAVYQEYKDLTDIFPSSVLLGEAQVVGIGNGQAVVNLFGQEKYGYNGERYTNYEAIYSGLEEVAKIARNRNLSVAIPYKIGCDRGGANWSIIYAMIESVFKNHTQPIVIYRYGGQWEHSFRTNAPSPTLSQTITELLV